MHEVMLLFIEVHNNEALTKLMKFFRSLKKVRLHVPVLVNKLLCFN